MTYKSVNIMRKQESLSLIRYCKSPFNCEEAIFTQINEVTDAKVKSSPIFLVTEMRTINE